MSGSAAWIRARMESSRIVSRVRVSGGCRGGMVAGGGTRRRRESVAHAMIAKRATGRNPAPAVEATLTPGKVATNVPAKSLKYLSEEMPDEQKNIPRFTWDPGIHYFAGMGRSGARRNKAGHALCFVGALCQHLDAGP